MTTGGCRARVYRAAAHEFSAAIFRRAAVAASSWSAAILLCMVQLTAVFSSTLWCRRSDGLRVLATRRRALRHLYCPKRATRLAPVMAPARQLGPSAVLLFVLTSVAIGISKAQFEEDGEICDSAPCSLFGWRCRQQPAVMPCNFFVCRPCTQRSLREEALSAL